MITIKVTLHSCRCDPKAYWNKEFLALNFKGSSKMQNISKKKKKEKPQMMIFKPNLEMMIKKSNWFKTVLLSQTVNL